jgi:hypothetical protein
MATEISGVTRRWGVSIVGVATAAVLCVGCSSSSIGHPNLPSAGGASSNSTSTAGGSTAPAGTSSSTPAGSIPTGALSGFCAQYAQSAAKIEAAFGASGGTNKSSLKTLAKLYDQFAATAPSSVKPAFEDIASAMNDLASGNTSALAGDAAKMESAEGALEKYFASGCH